MNARKLPATCLALALLLISLSAPAGAQADFGIKSFSAIPNNADTTVDFQAGSHPYDYTVSFTLNSDSEGILEGTLRELVVDLPPGLIGNPTAVPRCTGAQFEGQFPRCPGDTQIGVVTIKFGPSTYVAPVYNLTPPNGVPASLGFSAIGANSFQEASVRSDGDFGISVFDITIPTGFDIKSITETIWGVPAHPSHDAERQCVQPDGGFIFGCPSNVPPAPYLSLPTSCGEPLRTTLRVDSLENPGVFDSNTYISEEGGEPAGLSGCNQVEFEPTISSQPTTNLSDSPTGLDFTLHQPQNQDPEGLSTAHLKDTTVTLPEGLTLNPSSAGGLDACSEAGIGYAPSEGEIHFSKVPQSCPDASKVGTLEVKTPLLKDKLPGAVYLAKPYQNPFGSFLAIYLAIEDEQTGTVAKLAGEVKADPNTGQLSTTFKDNPQLPLEDIEVRFFGGPRASLKTPLACGTHTTTSTLVPWSTPEGATVSPSDSFQTSVAAGGSGACPNSEAGAPNRPSFSAGTVAPQAGAYSPFVFKIARPDGTQRLKAIDTILPKGLVGRLAGVPYCPEGKIAQALSREAPSQGALEQGDPSCPLASQLGSATVGAGAGITPFHVQGKAYLAGPYKGAPLSLLTITPAVAGPFDLGVVTNRAALYIDPETAQIHAITDPLPQIIQGIPVNVRSIAATLDRPNFSLNPTSCDPMAVLGSATSALGQLASLSSPFQVGGCKALKFAPKVSLRLKGGTTRGKHPALRAVVSYPKAEGYANIASAQVTLPRGEFIENTHFKTICTRVQFALDQCPKGSVYGKAKAFTPLLDGALTGPVYLRSSNHELPDLVVALDGQVEVDVAGRVDTGKNGGLRNTFEAAPDAPVSKFILEMQGGKKGLLVNSENICRKPQRAIVHFTAQNGKVFDAKPLVKNDCKAKKGRKGGKGGKGRGGRRG